MLPSSVVQADAPVISRALDENVTQNGRSGNFQGWMTTVLDQAGTSSSPSGAATTANQRERRVPVADSLREVGHILFQEHFRFILDGYSCFSLNKDNTRLITQDDNDTEIEVWLADSRGFFTKEGTIATDISVVSISMYQDSVDTLFVPCPSTKDSYILAVYEKDGTRGFKKTQELTSCDLLAHDSAGFNSGFYIRDPISSIVLSGDGTSVACLIDRHNGGIFSRGPDGKWVNKGNCMRYDKLIFSQDSNHIAITMYDKLSLMSKGADGEWTKTGSIGEGTGMWKMAFSPDNQHFIAWFNEDARDSKECDFQREFFVALFGLNHDNQWVEKTRITKIAPCPTKFYTLMASFSPDGKHLVVCGQDNFDIWALDNDDNWTPVLKDTPYSNGDVTIENIAKPVIEFATNSRRFMMLTNATGVVWGLNDNGLWGCQHSFSVNRSECTNFMPDGKAILTRTPIENGERGLWLEDMTGKWIWQAIDSNLYCQELNPVISLLPLRGPTRNTLSFMGPSCDGSWEKKGCIQLGGDFDFCTFSEDGRYLNVVSYVTHNQRVVSFLKMVADNSQTEAKGKTGVTPFADDQ